MKNYSEEVRSDLKDITLAFYYKLYALNVRSKGEFDLSDIPDFIKDISTKEKIELFTNIVMKHYWGLPV